MFKLYFVPAQDPISTVFIVREMKKMLSNLDGIWSSPVTDFYVLQLCMTKFYRKAL